MKKYKITVENSKSDKINQQQQQQQQHLQPNQQDLIIHIDRIKLNESRKDLFKKRVKSSFKTRLDRFDLFFYLIRVLIIVIIFTK